ncbi:thiamine-phosphate kinase [Methylacidiphilum caldifontis]|uniref:thiamine-phosphate kinase n=1 Tax=Methylacidiphilum caldifontis TaxID=2795386 RepID=UPI001A8D31C6|nr:thiamine-phosphate kinase [Methylacidiphilum caldifontis]QSR88089.1 thiamine-phosphate kinase [Methylacidiphilum caldifontis]
MQHSHSFLSFSTESLLSELSEDQLLEILFKDMHKPGPGIVGIGDDCAVVRAEKDNLYYLFKVDATLENVHFEPSSPAELIGRKALARALSDIAAMGGDPLYVLVGIGINKNEKIGKIKKIYEGINALAQSFGLLIIGGETTLSEQLFLVISIWGKTEGYKPILRSGATDGDSLFVTGVLGGSFDCGHHLLFIPKIKEGKWLAQGQWATAMMDISDGLAKDLPRMARASAIGFEIDFDEVPVRKGYSIKNALTDGEDYELLFSVAKEKEEKLLENWPFEIPLKKIGFFSKKGKLDFPDEFRGFDHFQKS